MIYVFYLILSIFGLSFDYNVQQYSGNIQWVDVDESDDSLIYLDQRIEGLNGYPEPVKVPLTDGKV